MASWAVWGEGLAAVVKVAAAPEATMVVAREVGLVAGRAEAKEVEFQVVSAGAEELVEWRGELGALEREMVAGGAPRVVSEAVETAAAAAREGAVRAAGPKAASRAEVAAWVGTEGLCRTSRPRA
jgi:hypothetical protein